MASQSEEHTAEVAVSRERKWPILFVTTLMVTALLVGPISVLELLAPQHPWQILILVVFIISIESYLTTNWLQSRVRTVNNLTYRFAELVVIIIFIRLLTWGIYNAPNFSDLRDLLINPFAIFDFFFVLFLLLTLLAWNRSLFFAGVFSRLSSRIKDASAFAALQKKQQDSDSYYIAPFDSSAILQDYYRGWIFGGVILVLATALTTISLQEVNVGTLNILNFRTINRLGMRPEVMLALIIYFAAGLWLASQARFTSSQAKWLMDKIEPEPSLTRSWGRSTLVIILIVCVIAAFLPIGSTLAVSHLIQIIIAGVVAIFGLLLAAFSFLSAFIFNNLLGTAELDGSEPEINAENLAPPSEVSFPAGDIPQYLLGVSFWIAVIAVSAFSLWFFFHHRGFRIRGINVSDLYNKIFIWFHSRLRPALDGIQNITAIIRNSLEAGVRRQRLSGGRISFFRLRNLSPREQIRFFYLSTVRRAGDKGLPRDKDLTPYEYSEEMKESLPEASLDLDSLTNAFIKARYSQQSIKESELGKTKSIWKRLRTALKKRKKLA